MKPFGFPPERWVLIPHDTVRSGINTTVVATKGHNYQYTGTSLLRGYQYQGGWHLDVCDSYMPELRERKAYIGKIKMIATVLQQCKSNYSRLQCKSKTVSNLLQY